METGRLRSSHSNQFDVFHKMNLRWLVNRTCEQLKKVNIPVFRKDSTATVNLARFKVCNTRDFTWLETLTQK